MPGKAKASTKSATSKRAHKTDHLTPIAIGAALIIVLASMILDGGNPAVLIKPAPLLLVFGGTICAALAALYRSEVASVRSVIRQAAKSSSVPLEEEIPRLVALAELARREGLLALERAGEGVGDPFFRKGIELVVDGMDPEDIRDIMDGEIEALRERHRVGARFFTDMGGFAPTLGILGTVMGLVHVLANMSDTASLGAGIASAFTATLWGVLSANIIWLPISNKLKHASEVEVRGQRMVLEGILAIQAGSSPRMIEARLLSYLPQQERGKIQRKKAA